VLLLQQPQTGGRLLELLLQFLDLTLHLLLFALHLPLVRLKCGQSILQETAAVGLFASLIANTKALHDTAADVICINKHIFFLWTTK
jgi:hypothetical protein